MATWYAWSNIYNGGETKEDDRLAGGVMVVKRNIIEAGSKVTAKDVGGQEAFDEMVEAGSIRPYAMPKDMGEYESPTQAVIRGLYKEGEIDPDKLLELTLIQETSGVAVNPPASEQKEVESKPAGA
jgi:hypothetical protein